MYPVKATVVPVAPHPIVLGLPFRRRFDNTLPRGSETQDYSGVTCICLGVPPSHGLTFPDALLRHAGYKNADPAQCDYRQVLEVKVSWSSLLQEGKELPAKELSSYLDTAF